MPAFHRPCEECVKVRKEAQQLYYWGLDMRTNLIHLERRKLTTDRVRE